jgi:hypothetical protein
MPKAILELPEMPESCWKCKLNKWDVWEHYRYVSINVLVCAALGEECSDKGRHKDCPLKLVEGCEYCNTEPEIIYRKDWTIFTKGEDKVVDINYCPMCGRRLEVEP